MKIKRYGKNKVALKKLVKDENTRIFFNGLDAKQLFEKLIGYDFIFNLTNKGLEITDCTGETFLLTTNISLEMA